MTPVQITAVLSALVVLLIVVSAFALRRALHRGTRRSLAERIGRNRRE